MWLVLVALEPLGQAVSPAGVRLLFLGGVAYTLGVLFYKWRRLPYHHAVWHLFVLAGSVLHYFAVLLYLPVAVGEAAALWGGRRVRPTPTVWAALVLAVGLTLPSSFGVALP